MCHFVKVGEMFLSVEVLAERFLAPGHAWHKQYININKDSDIDKINQLGTTKNSQTNTGTSNGNYGNNPLSNNNNNLSGNTSSQQGIERAQQITEVTTGLVELFTPSPEQIQRREQQAAEYARQKKIRDTRYQTIKNIESGS